MKRIALIALLLIALTGLALGFAINDTPAAEGPEFESDFVVVRAHFDNPALLSPVTAWQEPWEIDHEKGFIVLSTTPSEYEWLESLGFRLEIDEELTDLYTKPNEKLPGQEDGIPGYPCYRTVEETFADVAAIVQEFPHLSSWIDAGDSWEKETSGGSPGYDLMVLRLTNEDIAGPKPKLLISTGVHAREYTPPELSMRYAEYLVDNYGADADVTWLLDYHEIHLMLYVNPDGRKQAETGLSWRKNTNENYCSPTSSSRGADINRNFEFQWGCCGGSSGSQCSTTYRGPSAGSEPETQSLQNYGRSIFPDQRDDPLTTAAPITATGVYLDIHSSGKLVIWPWGFTNDVAPNGIALQTLGRKLAYFNDYEPSQSITLYPADGTSEEFGYGEMGLASYTIELGNSFFEGCGYFEDTLVPDNMPALLYAAKVVRTPYQTPAGPDALDIALGDNPVEPGDITTVTATIDDTKFNNTVGSEPVQNIVAAEYYVDDPPWITSTTPISMPFSAADGVFDSSIEDVTAALDTTGLETGRHMLFVRGKDASGNWGPFSSIFLFVVDPAVAPTIEGYVTAAESGAPLAASVSAGQYFSAATNPATGYYQLRVISGTYDLVATPDSPDFGVSIAEGIAVVDHQLLRQDFSLFPFCEIISDDVESGNQGWDAESTWAITNEKSHSPTHSWTDSPGGNYANGQNASLTSGSFDLTAYFSVTLNYWQICNTEAGYDYCQVEYSTDGGGTWQTKAAFDGLDSQWEEISLEFPEAAGSSEVLLRFRLESDFSVTANGWHVDDIDLRGAGPNCLAETTPLATFESSSPDPLGSTTYFSNTSTGGNLISEWDFGDGSPVVTITNPSHVFPLTGTFTVTLTVENTIDSDSVIGLVEIVEPGSSPNVYLPLVKSNGSPAAIKP